MDVEMGQPGSARTGGATPGSGSLPTTPRSTAGRPPLARNSGGNGPQPTPGAALTAGPQKVAAAAADRRTQITSQQKVHELQSQVKVLGADAVAKVRHMLRLACTQHLPCMANKAMPLAPGSCKDAWYKNRPGSRCTAAHAWAAAACHPASIPHTAVAPAGSCTSPGSGLQHVAPPTT